MARIKYIFERPSTKAQGERGSDVRSEHLNWPGADKDETRSPRVLVDASLKYIFSTLGLGALFSQ